MASKRLYLKEGDAHLEESALVHIIKPPGGSNDFHVWFQSMGYVAIDNITVEAGNTVPVPEIWTMLLTGPGLVGFAARRRLVRERGRT